jgi:ketosteroid isomerase-like protein
MLRSLIVALMTVTVAALSCASCASHASHASHASPMAASTPTTVDATAAEREIAAALDDFHDAAAHADEPRYFAHFAREAVFLGTDATERWDVEAFRQYAHARFATGKGWTYRSVRRAIRVSSDGAVAWFDEDLLGEKAGPCRGTGVFVRVREGDRDRYLIAQYNLTVTVPNDRFAAVRRAIDEPIAPTAH